MAQATRGKKLIEVSIPLEAINKASAREKSIRHGHPSTLHLWWARRPLAACRAVLFAQLVDDPSSWPDRFPTEEDQKRERERLHRVIEAMVPWEASTNEHILNNARWEIARSVAWGRGEEPPPKSDPAAVLAYLQEKAPPVYDPFCGGGSIPLEAQRLGLRAYGSDLNPVAVLISKALVEIPPKFAGLPPVNPGRDPYRAWKGAQGLAEDVRYYGKWMREEAEKRIGHLYPKAKLPDGGEATVIAWLWARTVASPDPMAKGAHVPLVSSFMLSTKKDKKAWVEVVRDPAARDGWRFEVRTGKLAPDKEKELKNGTKMSQGSFRCILSGAPISYAYADDEANSRRMKYRLMAIVAEGNRGRLYISPEIKHELVALNIEPPFKPDQKARGTFASNAQGRIYGFETFGDYFSSRQLTALTTFSDLVGEARERALADARTSSSLPKDDAPLADGGTGAVAYADAVATYLAMGVSRLTDICNALCRWESSKTQVRNLFGRQAIPMVWDFAEPNVFAEAAGDFSVSLGNLAKVIDRTYPAGHGQCRQIDAPQNSYDPVPAIISTDPPYYDNVGYAELSDFFYVWLRRSLRPMWPDLFRRFLTPKEAELVATPYRHGSRDEADRFFMDGMSRALRAMHLAASDEAPLTVFYAFKQSEEAADGLTSPGWASFLQAVVNAGFIVDGTWPLRTELGNRIVGANANVLASSIVLVCRKRPADAPVATRREFVARLRRVLPEAVRAIREAGVGPVDMQQAVIGPGMGVFSSFAQVLEDDDRSMTVARALALVNHVWDALESEWDATVDPETQVALAWYASWGYDLRPSGELITLANAKNTSLDALFDGRVFENRKGRAALVERAQLGEDRRSSDGRRTPVWVYAQLTARLLGAETGGLDAAAALVAEMDEATREAVRALAYRLYEIASRKGWAQEALVWNELAELWPELVRGPEEIGRARSAPEQGELRL